MTHEEAVAYYKALTGSALEMLRSTARRKASMIAHDLAPGSGVGSSDTFHAAVGMIQSAGGYPIDEMFEVMDEYESRFGTGRL